MKCTQYGFCSQAAFKNARAMFFSKLGGAGNNFRSGSKFLGRATSPESDTPHSSWGGGLMSVIPNGVHNQQTTPTSMEDIFVVLSQIFRGYNIR